MVVRVLIDENGRVVETEPISGIPSLYPAALEAASQARFTSRLLGGEVVKVRGYLTYEFECCPPVPPNKSLKRTRK